MLVLNRKKGESIVIADNIELSILDIQGDNIKIGIEAPREVKIYRKEIYQEIMLANRQAMNPNPVSLKSLKQFGNVDTGK